MNSLYQYEYFVSFADKQCFGNATVQREKLITSYADIMAIQEMLTKNGALEPIILHYNLLGRYAK